MNTLIIITSIIGVILLLVLLTVNTVSVKMDYISKNNVNKTALQISESPEFQAGLNHGFSLIQICLFKMWEDQEILDFDSISDEIKQTLNNVTQDKESFMKWQDKYVEYLKKKKGDNNDDDM